MTVLILKQPARLPHYLTIPEQERLLAHMAAAESLAGQRHYALIATALFCGLRVEELVTLRCSAVDLEAGKLTVVGKGDKQREYVFPRLRAILTAYLRDVRPKLMERRLNGYLERPVKRITEGHGRVGRLYRLRHWQATFTLDGKAISRATGTADEREARRILADMRRDFTKAQESPYLFPRAHHGHFAKAGQPLLTRSVFHLMRLKVSPIVGRPVSPHMLRHSFASHLRENGAPLELIQTALGHASVTTTLIYARISTKKRREDIAQYLEGGDTGTTRG